MHRLTKAQAPGPDDVKGPMTLWGNSTYTKKKIMHNFCVALSCQGGKNVFKVYYEFLV